MPQNVPALNEGQRSLIAKTLNEWAKYHPRPMLPIIQLADGSELTPSNIANAVAEPDSYRGRLVYRVFAAGLIEDDVEPPETLEDILSDYRRDIEIWRFGPTR
jgi:hypothetical protein